MRQCSRDSTARKLIRNANHGRKIGCLQLGGNFVTLELAAEDGIYGLGDARPNGRELAVASYLADHVIPLLVGREARRIEDSWQFL